ncbi:restriction endonuclease subunit S [Candidatus Falkowbacteria bacterium]|nr:restriction endonuclease subunit S [Candidatus Falkowbacteria bacterium]
MKTMKLNDFQQLNSQIFTVWSDEIRERFDPYYFRVEFRKNMEQIDKSKFKVVRFGELMKDLKNGVEIRTYSDSGYRYLRVTDIDDFGLNSNDPRHVKVDQIPEKIKLSEDDFLISRSGSLGLVSIVTDKMLDYILSSHIFKISLDTEKILPEYLAIFFRGSLGQLQFFQKNNGGIVPEINQGALKSIKIPLPPLATQNKIVTIMQKAYAEKKQKEEKAQKLLASIDGYVLGELGIKAPEIKREMVFEVGSDRVGNSRMDPLFYSQRNIYGFLRGTKFKIKFVEDLVEYLQTGFAAGSKNQEADGVIQIRPTNIDNNGYLKFDKNIYVKGEYVNTRQKDILQKEEILFNNTNSQELVGKTSYFNLDGYYFCSNHITRIKVKEGLNPIYLKLIFNIYQKIGIFYNICTNWNNQSGVNIKLLKTIKIPIPSLVTQNKIVGKVKSHYSYAQTLQKKAREVLNKAKELVEGMILR